MASWVGFRVLEKTIVSAVSDDVANVFVETDVVGLRVSSHIIGETGPTLIC